MNRTDCLCHLQVDYDKCPLHGKEIRGVPMTDEEFVELAKRNKNVFLDIMESVVDKAEGLIGKINRGRPRKGGDE